MSYLSPPYKDRRDAGLRLAAALGYLKKERPVIFALPRGGVPVAYEIAYELSAPLDVLLVRKMGAPQFAELAVGAVVEGHPPQRVINADLVKKLKVSEAYLDEEQERQLGEIERRRQRYCGDRPPLQTHGRTVIVVDDGMATGATMEAALRALSQTGAQRLIFAVPVAPPEVRDRLCRLVDDGICLLTPPDFQSVGNYYWNFDQTLDEEVVSLLERQYADVWARLGKAELEDSQWFPETARRNQQPSRSSPFNSATVKEAKLP